MKKHLFLTMLLSPLVHSFILSSVRRILRAEESLHLSSEIITASSIDSLQNAKRTDVNQAATIVDELSFNSSMLQMNQNKHKSEHSDFDYAVTIDRRLLEMSEKSKIRFLAFGNHDSSRETMLILPGFDGHGNYSAKSLSNFTKIYNVWKLNVAADDRSEFNELAQTCIKFIQSLETPVILMGESFGGLLASYIATKDNNTNTKSRMISKLILINPATSYDRSVWPIVGPLITKAGPAFPVVGMGALLTTSVDSKQIQRITREYIQRFQSFRQARDELNALFEEGMKLIASMPPETIAWRISKHISVGHFLMENRYDKIQAPTLVIVGVTDRLLPSKEEGRLLVKKLNNTKVEVLELQDSSHYFLDGSIDLEKVVSRSKTFNSPKESFNNLDCPFPSQQDLDDVDQQLGFYFKSFSPVFLSKQNGRLLEGIESLPVSTNGRPVLLVGNHQFFGADMALMIREYIETKGILPRGLAHPIIFSERGPAWQSLTASGDPVQKRNNSFQGNNLLLKFGAVRVGPMTFYDLLKRNETILLFPGGGNEALYADRHRNYKLFWPERSDFVRMATMFDAVIVPFSAIGMAESIEVIAEVNEIEKFVKRIPFLRNRLERSPRNIPQARPDGNETFSVPLFRPLPPSRNYFLFHEPFDTRTISYKNKTECKVAYQKIKQDVKDGLNFLQDYASKDPFRQFLPRFLYEQRFRRKAPIPPKYNEIIRRR